MIFDSSTVCGRVFFGSKDKQIVENDNAKPWKLTLVILTASSLLMSASYTMLVPFLPMYLIQELNVAQDEVNLWSGIIFAISFAISGIMAPIWGAMADKKSRKLMAVRAAICLSITYVLGGLVQDVWQLFGVRVLQGAMTAGGVLGPLMGGLLAEAFGMRAAFFLGGVGLFIITLLIIFYIKEPPRKKVERVESSRPKTNLLKVPVVQRMLLCAGVVQLTILLQQPIMPLYVGELQGSMDRIVLVTGMLFSIVGISGVIASPVWGIVGQKWGFRPALYLALLGSGIFGMIQAIPTTLVPFGVWRFIGGLAFAGIFPAINAVLSQSSAPEDRGRIFGLSYAAQQVGSVIGPIVGGAMAMYLPLKFVIFTSGFVLIPLVIFLYLMRPKVEPNTKGDPANLG